MSSRIFSHFLLLLLFLAGIQTTQAQESILNASKPNRLVNDFAGILSADDAAALESKVVAFDDSTSTQITVVIVNSLEGYDISDLAQRLGQKWGVGSSDFKNGFVILIKPKSGSEKGEAFIATGYGVESLIPDATAWDIVNNEMIPHFRQNDYYGGINAAIDTIMKFTSGEFKASTYGKKNKGSSGIAVALILFVIFFIIFTRNRNNRNINRGGSSTMFWPFFFGGGGGSSWGSFSGGSGGFGGGGFGGFGGGSFGGGGAGGSW